MALLPRESGKFISQFAKFIKINEAGVQNLAKEIAQALSDGSLGINRFSQSELHPNEGNNDGLNWIFVADTLNFCFWSPGKEKWTVTYRGKPYTGYFALCAALNRALDEGFKITDPSYFSQITEKDLTHILRSDNGCPPVKLIVERQKCLHQVGHVLLEKYEGTFSKVLERAGHSAATLLNIIIQEFECFRDEAEFEGKRVGIYKRAQILVGDIWACCRGRGLGAFEDIGVITMFADYRVPQVLIHFGALEYKEELLNRLRNEELLENGSREEVEIRGMSIEAVELVLEEVKKLLPTVSPVPTSSEAEIVCNSILIDHFLWDYRRAHANELEYIPFHRTFSIYY